VLLGCQLSREKEEGKINKANHKDEGTTATD